MKYVAIFFVRIYQWCIAPLIGDVCRFTPTCSHYAIDALQKHGLVKGCWLAFKRIIRCNPWCDGGHDPVK